jgi:hypothetical protein
MMILEYVPTSASSGVPDNAPVLLSNVVHFGAFWMVKDNDAAAPADDTFG